MYIPLVTVITVVYNSVSNIEDTIVSVLNQSYRSFEYIIIDGGSKDGTLEVLRRYNSDLTLCISEPDMGIYDAMNKGVKFSKGDWVIFINAGDKMHPHAIKTFVEGFDHISQIVYGNIEIFFNNKLKILNPGSLKSINYRMPFCHQGVFVAKSLLEENPFDLNYKLAGDYNFFLYAYKAKQKFQYLNCTVAYYDLAGVSMKQYKHMLAEIRRAIASHNGFASSMFYQCKCLYHNRFFLLKDLFVRGLGEKAFDAFKNFIRKYEI